MIESAPPRPQSGVNIQDVEHDARPETRVDNAGIEVKPRPKKPGAPDTEREGDRDSESILEADIERLPAD
jgi:hypothetical protein